MSPNASYIRSDVLINVEQCSMQSSHRSQRVQCGVDVVADVAECVMVMCCLMLNNV
jgi:hypothetical protein